MKTRKPRKPREGHKEVAFQYVRETIQSINEERTGSKFHRVTFFDDAGNKRIRLIPNAVFFECLKGGMVFYRVCNDGVSFTPLTGADRPIVYKSCKQAIKLLVNYNKTNA
jgi:hypothetical protein